jgi:hypothetical protein
MEATVELISPLDVKIISALLSYFEKMEYVYEIKLLCLCVCVSVYPPIVARQRLGKSPLIVAMERLRFPCGPCRIKGKQAISPWQNFLFAFS